MKATKVFITGSTGYIGHELALRLANMGYTVKALVRDIHSSKIPQHDHIEPCQGDICKPNTLKEVMSDCDCVFHLAAFTDIKSHDISKFYKINVEGTENLIKEASACGVKKFILSSSLSVFGPALYKVPITEKQPRLHSIDNDYELTKIMAEEVIMKYANTDMSCSILNISRVYGPGMKTYSNGVNKIIKKIMKDRILITPSRLESEANYVFIDDVIKAQIGAMHHAKNGEKYIIGGENADYKKLFNVIRGISKSKVRIFQINYSLLRSIIGFYSGLSKLIGLNTLVTPGVLDSLFTNRSASSAKAVKILKYDITQLKTGIERTVEHLKLES